MLRCFRETEAWLVEKRGLLKLAGRWARLSPQCNLSIMLPTCVGMIGCPAKYAPSSLDLRGFRAKEHGFCKTQSCPLPPFGRIMYAGHAGHTMPTCRHTLPIYVPYSRIEMPIQHPAEGSRFEMKPSNVQMRRFFLLRLAESSCLGALEGLRCSGHTTAPPIQHDLQEPNVLKLSAPLPMAMWGNIQ